MENKDTNTDYQKFVKVRDQKWETQICNPSQFFCLRFVFTIFYTESFQVPLEKNHRHLKCQFSPKILTWPKSILYKDSEKWLISLPPKLCPSTTSFLKAHHTTSLGTQSKAFSKSTDTKYKFFFSAKYCPCNCFKIKMAFAVPHSGINPNYILSMFPCCLTNLSIILSAIFKIRSVHLSPL